MKKFLFSTLLLLLSIIGANAQSNKVLSAFNYYKNGQPALAKEMIDAACLDPETSKEAKTYFYKGNIYLLIYKMAHYTDGIKKGLTMEEVEYRIGKTENIRTYKKLPNGTKLSYPYDLEIYLSDGKVDSWLYPNEDVYKKLDDGNTLKTAYDAYQKALSIEPEINNPMLDIPVPHVGLQLIANFHFNQGVDFYNQKDYKAAYKDFAQAQNIYQNIIGQTNENLIYYTGVCAEVTGDTTKAIEYYQIIVKSKGKKLEAYSNLSAIYLALNKSAKAVEVIKKGREIDPKNQNLLINEANIYLKEGKAEEAKNVLTLAIQQDPTNASLHFAIGTMFDKIASDTTKNQEVKNQAMNSGMDSYKKAIEVKPDFFDAYFNLGALLNNRAAELFIIAKNLPLGDPKYDGLMAEGTKLLEIAIPYLEKANELDPKDRNTLILLKNAYAQTRNTEKYKIAKAKLDALQ